MSSLSWTWIRTTKVEYVMLVEGVITKLAN